MRTFSWLGVSLLWLTGCQHRPPAIEALADVDVMVVARARPVLDPVKARFTVKLRSKQLDIAGTTGGGIIADRPGRSRIELFGPMGGSLLAVVSDGRAISVTLPGAHKQLVSEDAENVLREATGGVAGLDDLVAMLVGDLPFDSAPVRSQRVLPDDAKWTEAVLDGPRGTSIEVQVEREHATPHQMIARNAAGEPLIVARFDSFQEVMRDGAPHWMPTEVDLWIPAVDLTIETRFKDWQPLIEAPAVFSVQPIPGMVVSPLEDAVRDAVAGMKGKR